MQRILLLLLATVFVGSTLAQKNKSTAPVASALNAEQYKGIKWRNIGPGRGGRANAIAGHPTNE
ncbi:MAG: hypothetical protein ACKOC0_03835, partial [Cytophagales bacterium]